MQYIYIYIYIYVNKSKHMYKLKDIYDLINFNSCTVLVFWLAKLCLPLFHSLKENFKAKVWCG